MINYKEKICGADGCSIVFKPTTVNQKYCNGCKDKMRHLKELEQWWQEQFGYDFAKLTESEARYINKQIHRDGIDAVRDKLIAARLEASS